MAWCRNFWCVTIQKGEKNKPKKVDHLAKTVRTLDAFLVGRLNVQLLEDLQDGVVEVGEVRKSDDHEVGGLAQPGEHSELFALVQTVQGLGEVFDDGLKHGLGVLDAEEEEEEDRLHGRTEQRVAQGQDELCVRERKEMIPSIQGGALKQNNCLPAHG